MTLRHIQSIASTLDYRDNFGQKATVKVELLPSGEVWLGLWSKRGEFDGFVLGDSIESASKRLSTLVWHDKKN